MPSSPGINTINSAALQPEYTTELNYPTWREGIAKVFINNIMHGAGLPTTWDTSQYGDPTIFQGQAGIPASVAININRWIDSGAWRSSADDTAWITRVGGAPPAKSDNDYIPTPEESAKQIAIDQWNKSYNLNVRQQEFQESKFMISLAVDSAAANRAVSSGSSRAAGGGGGGGGGGGDQSLQYAQLAIEEAKLQLQRELGMGQLDLDKVKQAADERYQQAQIAIQQGQLDESRRQFNENMAYNKQRDSQGMLLDLFKAYNDRAKTTADVMANPADSLNEEYWLRKGNAPAGTPVDIFSGDRLEGQPMTLQEVQQLNAQNADTFNQTHSWTQLAGDLGVTGPTPPAPGQPAAAPAAAPSPSTPATSGSPAAGPTPATVTGNARGTVRGRDGLLGLGLVRDKVSLVGEGHGDTPGQDAELMVNPTGAPVGFVPREKLPRMRKRSGNLWEIVGHADGTLEPNRSTNSSYDQSTIDAVQRYYQQEAEARALREGGLGLQAEMRQGLDPNTIINDGMYKGLSYEDASRRQAAQVAYETGLKKAGLQKPLTVVGPTTGITANGQVGADPVKNPEAFTDEQIYWGAGRNPAARPINNVQNQADAGILTGAQRDAGVTQSADATAPNFKELPGFPTGAPTTQGAGSYWGNTALRPGENDITTDTAVSYKDIANPKAVMVFDQLTQTFRALAPGENVPAGAKIRVYNPNPISVAPQDAGGGLGRTTFTDFGDGQPGTEQTETFAGIDPAEAARDTTRLRTGNPNEYGYSQVYNTFTVKNPKFPDSTITVGPGDWVDKNGNVFRYNSIDGRFHQVPWSIPPSKGAIVTDAQWNALPEATRQAILTGEQTPYVVTSAVLNNYKAGYGPVGSGRQLTQAEFDALPIDQQYHLIQQDVQPDNPNYQYSTLPGGGVYMKGSEPVTNGRDATGLNRLGNSYTDMVDFGGERRANYDDYVTDERYADIVRELFGGGNNGQQQPLPTLTDEQKAGIPTGSQELTPPAGTPAGYRVFKAANGMYYTMGATSSYAAPVPAYLAGFFSNWTPKSGTPAATPPAAGGGTTPPPAAGGSTPPPAAGSGGTTPPPAASSGGTTPPPAGGSTGSNTVTLPNGTTMNVDPNTDFGKLIQTLFGPGGIYAVSYGAGAYQDAPGMRFLSGQDDFGQYAQLTDQDSVIHLSNGETVTVPAPSKLNVERLLWMKQNDPSNYARYQGIWKGANRNLDNELANLLARAPLGQAANPTTIAT